MSDTCSEEHTFENWRGRDICTNCGYTNTPGIKETLMEHDPLCTARNKILVSPITCTYCQLIRSVRMEYEN